MKEGQQFGRLITASVTAFDNYGGYVAAANRNLAKHLAGPMESDSIVSAGTTGESPTLSQRQRLQHLQDTMIGAEGRAKVIAGTGTNNTRESITLSKLAQAEGADGLLLVVPPYNRPSQTGLVRHFGRIAESVDIPCIVYNVPSRTGTNLEASTVLELDKEFDNIVGLKEAVGVKTDKGRTQIAMVLEGKSDGFEVWSGNDEDTLDMMRMGAYGVVSVASHLKGDLIKRMMEHQIAGDENQAQWLHDHLTPLFEALFPPISPEANPSGVKAMLNLSGVPVGTVRGPLLDILSEPSYSKHRERLQLLLADYKLVPPESN